MRVPRVDFQAAVSAVEPTVENNAVMRDLLLRDTVSNIRRQAVTIAREELVYRLEDLTRFEYITPEGRDQGVNVRHRCGPISDFEAELSSNHQPAILP